MSFLHSARSVTSSLRNLAITTINQKASAQVLKRPPSMFLQFQSERFQAEKKANPTLNAKDISRKLAVEWNKLPDSIKKSYKDKYEVAMQEYRKKVDKLPQAKVEQMKDEKVARKEMKKIRELKSELRELETDRPSRSLTGYMLFVKDKLLTLPKSLSQEEKLKKAAEDWKKLPESQKDQLKKRSKELGEQYSTELEKWTQKTVTDGRFEKIRSIRKELREISLKV